MKKILLIIILLFMLPVVAAGNNTVPVDNPTMLIEDCDTVVALEDGDSNISFTDGYKGYCAEWGKHSAEKGDEFYVHNEVDNNIKVYFVHYYNETTKDKIATQHMIWKFTDNKEFSRFNKTLYHQIIDTSKEIHLNDSGRIKYNSTHYLVYDFKLFKSKFVEYQDYIGIKIYFEKILSVNNTIIINDTFDKNTTSNLTYENNATIIQVNQTYSQKHKLCSNSSTLIHHKTGTNIILLLFAVLILIKYRKKVL
jgi:hypothetical protein